MGSNIDAAPTDLLNDIDKKILSASILGADITEVYSPERVARGVKKFGLVLGARRPQTIGVEEDERRSTLSVDRLSALHVLQCPSGAQQDNAWDQARVDREVR